MTTQFRKLIALIFCVAAFSSISLAQQQPAPERIPLKIQIVLSRYEGDKKVSSLPYTMLILASSVNNGNSSIRNSARVPVISSPAPAAAPAAGAATAANAKPASNQTYSYSDIGTSIDCTVFSENGRFRVQLTINDSSIANDATAIKPGTAPGPINPPVIRTFSFNDSFYMKDGETKQFASVPDRTVGDVTKVDITLTAEK